MNIPSNIGRYKVVKAIGHGGMGTLYLAWDDKLERQIAIKVLKDDDDDLRERFAREAKSAARLRHPHIVTVFDLGEHDGQPYIAMEYIHGRTLAQIVRDREVMPLGRALELMAALCDGLAFAHKAGIIHRDVKPANIMVDERGLLKILDFGIARLAESAGMTQAGMMIGTLNYMSPEQIMGQTVDHRSDIFAVGLVFYELLAQREAFPGSISTGILGKLLHSEPVPLAQACPGLDGDVVRIVGRAIEKDVSRRYQDLTEMRREYLTVRGHVEAGEGLTVVRETPAPHRASLKSPSERRASERGEIAQRRASQIQHYLDQADHAIGEERYESAIVACEHLLMLDAENARALDLVDRARAAIEARQAKQLLGQAERDLQAGSLTIAAQRINQAGLLQPSAQQEELREEVERAREARERGRVAAEEVEVVRRALATRERATRRELAPSDPTIARPSRRAEPAEPESRTVLLPDRGATPKPIPRPEPKPTPRRDPHPTPQPEVQPAPQRSASSSSWGGMIAIAAVVVILLAGGAYYWLGPFRSPAPTSTQQASAPAPQPQPAAPASVPAPSIDSPVTPAVDRPQGQLSASDRNQALASAKAAETKRTESARQSSIDRFNEAKSFEQQRQYDLADARYHDAIAADTNNKDAATAIERSERYRKARNDGRAAFKANDREASLRALGEARSTHPERFTADGLEKTLAEAERIGAAKPPPPAEPAPADDQSAIASVLSNLAKALSTETNKSRDLNVVRRLWPSAGGDVFEDIDSQEYLLSNPIFVAVNAATASVDYDRARAIKSRSTGRTNITRDNVRIELSKAGGAWQVVSIKERSK